MHHGTSATPRLSNAVSWIVSTRRLRLARTPREHYSRRDASPPPQVTNHRVLACLLAFLRLVSTRSLQRHTALLLAHSLSPTVLIQTRPTSSTARRTNQTRWCRMTSSESTLADPSPARATQLVPCPFQPQAPKRLAPDLLPAFQLLPFSFTTHALLCAFRAKSLSSYSPVFADQPTSQ